MFFIRGRGVLGRQRKGGHRKNIPERKFLPMILRALWPLVSVFVWISTLLDLA
jgi:hypothetical protein